MGERSLDLASRREGTREKVSPAIVKFCLNEIKEHFDENLGYIREQFFMADERVENGKEDEAENIWSAQIVFLESAFDFYLHGLTKFGLSEMFTGNWQKTEKYSNLSVKMSIVDKALNAREDSAWFLEFVDEFYREITLVSYQSVKDQMNLLGLNLQEIVDAVFYERDSSVKTKDKMESFLKGLYHKRNVIAHQSGRRHSDARREEVTKDMVENYINGIEKIVGKIQEMAKNK